MTQSRRTPQVPEGDQNGMSEEYDNIRRGQDRGIATEHQKQRIVLYDHRGYPMVSERPIGFRKERR